MDCPQDLRTERAPSGSRVHASVLTHPLGVPGRGTTWNGGDHPTVPLPARGCR
ncbi:hypothetical protein STRAU_5015 [Streptomyces aurantiacus JA 4570]|uniref:Uncharacterized protein n=1 Tax=Streptomyces aurantiacus JA 4570 TaxID=1286094 RepID=S3ZU09_9ACTN|nr:hypothetical protein STRAU_5015 [Streptomyces aurantiacus JA 4570]